MATRIAVNGFGRIGRLTLSAIPERYPVDFEVVALNDIGNPETNAYACRVADLAHFMTAQIPALASASH